MRHWALIAAVVGMLVLAGAGAFVARAADPIKIGFGMALTGGLSANGKPALLALQIWKDDVNKKGGLLGRPVELVFYDDQTNPATVPGIYTKLLDVDKVDLVISGYGTNLIAPLMPIAMERKLTIMGMFGLANNEKYKYPNYFQIPPTGPDPETSTAIGFFELAAKQNPKPQTVAMVGRRRRVSAERAGRRARAGQEVRLQDRLRQDLPAEHRRLHADRPRDQGHQPRHRVRGVVPAGLGRHAARGARGRAAAQDLRRRHGGPAVHDHHDEHGPDAERHRELRLLGAGADVDVPRHQGVLQGVPGARGEGGRRSARVLPAALLVRGRARSWARPSRPPRASTSRRSPTTSAPPSSTPSWAR